MIEINLLPKELQRKTGGFGVPKAALAGLAAAAVLVVALAGLTYYQSFRMRAIKDDIARVEAKAQRMRKDIELVDQLVDVKTKILRRLTAIESLDRDRAAWVQNLEDLSTVIPEFLWLTEFRQGDGISTKPVKAPVNAPPVNEDSVRAAKNNLLLHGYCFTISSLANLIMNLQDSPRFSNIQLKHAKLTEISERRVYDFQVVCRLEPVTTDVEEIGDTPATQEKLGQDAISENDGDQNGLISAAAEAD